MQLVSDDQLVSELWLQDVQFLMGKALTDAPMLSPENLLISLAKSQDARVQLSLIPLLLRHPEFANKSKIVDKNLSDSDTQLIFRCYFTAAMLFQRIYKKLLSQYFNCQLEIPDLFSEKIGIIVQDPESALHELAKRHQVLSGKRINWLGTYKHAPDIWLRQLELQYS